MALTLLNTGHLDGQSDKGRRIMGQWALETSLPSFRTLLLGLWCGLVDRELV